MSGGHEGQSRKVKEGQQHFFSVYFFSARGGFLDLQCANSLQASDKEELFALWP